MTTTERRYDIDWLRVIAIGLLLIYHIAIVFQPWGVFIGFIQSSESLEFLWIPMSMLNIWRIPLLFYISGMGVGFAIRKRNLKQLIGERSRRILIPFLFGMFAIAPLHMFIWQKYYSQDPAYIIHPGHLWFLSNIFIYVILLTPLFLYFKNNGTSKVADWLDRIYSTPLGMLVVIVPFILEAILLDPEIFATFSLTLHGFLVGIISFFFGFTFISSGDNFWIMIRKWKGLFLLLASALFIVRFSVFNLGSPNVLIAIESNCWILASIGYAHRYLNQSGRVLSYLSQGAYPIYILHMVFLYLGSRLILPLEISAIMKFIMILIFTGTGCLLTYEIIIRRIRYIRPLFGMRFKK